jgi:AAHS family benzoate transporter-like MFS transporter
MSGATAAEGNHPPATASETAIDVSKWLDNSKLNGFNFGVFFACLILSTMEGYDLYVYSAAIPTVMGDLHLNEAQAGAIASAVSLGTLIGALVFGPLADRIGRKKVILWTTVLSCASMAATGLSQGFDSFAASRMLFGFANGGMIVNIMALASEYIPRRSRVTMIGLIASGSSIGSAVGALLGIWLFPIFGWRPVFLGASVLIVLFPLYVRLLPEGTSYLVRSKRLAELMRYLMKARPAEAIADGTSLRVDEGKRKVPLSEVFREHRALGTFLLWFCYTANLYVIHGFTFWLPKLMIDRGLPQAKSLALLLPLALVSILMTFLCGRIADRVGAKPVLAALYLLSAASIALLGITHNYLSLMLLVGLAGAGFNGAQNMINAYSPSYYPPSMRSTATSYNFAFGRLGGIIGPMATGFMMMEHLSFQIIFFTLAIPSVLALFSISNVPEKFSFTNKLSQEDDAYSAPSAPVKQGA